MAFAGGWIDQPFISAHNPSPPGSMVVVSLEPTFHFHAQMRNGNKYASSGYATFGDGALPDKDPQILMRELYNAENTNRTDPSGSQDMAGIIFPGVSRLDYDVNFEGGYFPAHVESNNDPEVASWLREYHLLSARQPTATGIFSACDEKNLDPSLD